MNSERLDWKFPLYTSYHHQCLDSFENTTSFIKVRDNLVHFCRFIYTSHHTAHSIMEKVQFQLEATLPELKDLYEKGLFAKVSLYLLFRVEIKLTSKPE